MPIFDQGYQHWSGKLSGHAWRWLAITEQGVRVQAKKKWIARLMVLALLPALVLACVLVFWGLFEQKSALLAPFMFFLQNLPKELAANPREFRPAVWTICFNTFLDFEVFISMLLVLFVGPNLISQDLRFNAMPLYFSRPLSRIDYFFGKLGIIATFLGAVTMFPILLAYLLGLMFSLDLTVLKDTGPLLLASLGYAVILIASAGTLMLALSSLSRSSRNVAALWIGIWVATNIVAGVLHEGIRIKWGHLVSFTGNLRRVREHVLNTDAAWKKFEVIEEVKRQAMMQERFQQFRPEFYPWHYSMGVLAAIIALSALILSLRIKSLDRLK